MLPPLQLLQQTHPLIHLQVNTSLQNLEEYLLEPDIRASFSEALSANHQSVFPDQSLLVCANATTVNHTYVRIYHWREPFP